MSRTRQEAITSKRSLSVWLPTFAIDRLRQATLKRTPEGVTSCIPDNQPFALIQSGVRGLTISAVNDPAHSEGIRMGQVLADARAAIPSLLTRPAEPEHDQDRLYELAYAAGRYGPARNVEGDDGFWVDITGVGHLFGGEPALARDLLRRLAKTGYRASVGIADTPAAAFALARYAASAKSMTGPVTIAQPNVTAPALADLEVAALRLEPQTVVLLKRLGLRRIGQLYDLPRTVLARRFRELKHRGAGRAAEREGLVQAVVMRLDQALGRCADPRVPLTEPPVYIVRRSYPEMLITSQGIETACHELADELCTVLAARHIGGRRLRFALYRTDGTVATAMIGTHRPCRTTEHLLELFREKLVNLDVGFGVDMITLEASQVDNLSEAQECLTDNEIGTAADRRDSTVLLIDRLANRLGRKTVFRLETAASHIPENAQRRVMDFAGKPGDNVEIRRTRPPFLFSRPEPITVIAEVPEGPPARFTWRRATHRIIKAEGPERICPEWWQWLDHNVVADETNVLPTRMRVRDYYKLEDESGVHYWVFRAGLYQHEAEEGPPAWYMHGLFG